MALRAPDLSLHVTTSGEPVGRVTSIGARREVRRLLTGRITHPDLDAVLLATTELVNNALTHASPGLSNAGCTVRVWFDDPLLVRVEVADSSPVLPGLPAQPAPSQLSGRGLNIVDTLVDRWGADPVPDPTTETGGKFVWFELDLGRTGHVGWTTGSHM